MRRFLKGVSILLIIVLVLAACGGGNNNNDNNNNGNNNNNNNNNGSGEAYADGKQEIDFWHAMSGDNGEALEAIIDKFNKYYADIHIDAIYLGSYDDLLTSLNLDGGSDLDTALYRVF